MTRVNAGVWGGIVVFLFSVIFFVQSLQYPYTGDLGLGPGFFPIWLSGILVILSILYIVESINGKNVSEESWPPKEILKKIAFIIGDLILFVILFLFAGFVLAGTVFLFLLLYKAYKWYISLPISIGIPVFLFWLFDIALGIPLS